MRLYELQLHVAAPERRQIEREHELGTLVRHTKQFAALEVGRTRREYEAALAEKDAEVDGFRRELDALIDEMGLLVEAAREQAAQAQATVLVGFSTIICWQPGAGRVRVATRRTLHGRSGVSGGVRNSR